MRTLTITAAEWASVQDGTLWLVREGWPEGYESVVSPVPPVEFVQACAPCETCGDQRIATSGGPGYFKGGRLHHLAGGQTVMEIRCPDCRIELVGPCICPTDVHYLCAKSECPTVTLGHAYAVGGPLPIVAFGSGHGLVGRYLVVVNQKVFLIVNEKLPVDATKVTDRLAHYGPPESLVGKWAIELRVVGS